jgi:hypothetical protein
MPSRRTFLRSAAAVVAAPALGSIAARSSLGVDFPKPAPEAAGMTAYLKDDSLQIRYDNLPLVAYRAQSSLKYPYFCPLNGPASGLSLTAESALPYPHHRGLWLGCDPLNGGNYWADNGLESGQIRSTELVLDEAAMTKLAGDRKSVGFTQKCEWRREGSNPFNDARRHVVTRENERLTFIDCDFTLTAGEDVSIIGAKHSFFALRAAADISPPYGGTMVNSHGGVGAEGTYAKTADWCGYYGKRRLRPDVTEGIAIMNHPENFGGNCLWFTRDYGHLSPSPFNFNKEPWTLAAGKTLQLRYRVVLFAGEPNSVGLNDVFRAWVG